MLPSKGRRIVIGKKRSSVEDDQMNEVVPEPSEEVARPAPTGRICLDLLGLDLLSPIERLAVFSICQQSYIHHLLYILSILPSPHQQIKKDMASIQTADRLSLKDRKFASFINSMDELLGNSDAITNSMDASACYLGIGPSLHNLKLVFPLHTHSPCHAHNPSQWEPLQCADPKPINADRWRRQFLHRLVEHEAGLTAAAPHKVPPSGQIFIFFHTTSPTVPQQCPDGFYLSEAFSLSKRKSLRMVQVLLGSGQQEQEQEELLGNEDDRQRAVWVLPRQGIRYTRC